jgi:hypothetical protein
MKTREEWIAQHKKNVAWVNEQIRICLMARRLLYDDFKKDYYHLIHNASEHNRPELLPLREKVCVEHNEFFSLRFQNYDRGILSDVFDIRKWLYEARMLKWKEAEKPYLAG